jgi:alpha-tubulin suppressor-like RCC1 family protein
MVTTGSQHSCALEASGVAYCWGEASGGQLGDGLPTNRAQTSPVRVAASVAFVSVVAGTHHTCGLTAGGAALCWGMTYDAIPRPVGGSLSFAALAPGFVHTCGLTREGAVWCWGDNTFGQLGTGGTYPSEAPVRVASSLSFVGIAAGMYATCALSAGGEAWCWGDNESGTLGVETAGRCSIPGVEDNYGPDQPPRVIACAPAPVRVPTPLLRSLAAGPLVNGAFAACGVAVNDDLVCWGYAEEGVPRAVLGAGGLTSLAPAASGWCGLDREGGAWCWEYLRREPWWTAPRAFTPTLAFQTISGGYGVSCGITKIPAGIVHCWGRNDRGQLGDGTTTPRSFPAPVVVPSGP